MPRPATGSVLPPAREGHSWRLRVRAYGKRHMIVLGRSEDGWTRAKAEAELRLVQAQIELGKWQPPAPKIAAAPAIDADPTFHEFASDWLAARAPELRPATVQAYRNELSYHLLPFFHAHRLSQITVAEVDRYREHKLREAEKARDRLAKWRQARDKALAADQESPPRPPRVVMSPSYINGTITRLGAILDVADERGLLTRNPVRVNPRNRKAKVSRTRRAYLDRPDQIEALLAAAGRLDSDARRRRDRDTCLRRPLLATLLFAGLRIGEALALRWRDVDLAGGRIRVGDSKTDAGVRWVPIVPALRDELLARKAATAHGAPTDPVFANLTGRPMTRDNVRTRLLGPACEMTDRALHEAGLVPLPERLTLHSLRHTYISLRVALGDDLAAIAEDAGHADIGVTARIYTHVMRLKEGDRDRLRALVTGADWAHMGTQLADGAREAGLEEAS